MQSETTVRRQSFFDPSQFLGSILLGVVGGGAAGLVAGLLARGAMRGVALGIGQTPGFTAGGTFFILVLGAVLGAIIGVLFSFSLPIWPGSARRKGAILGAILAGIVALPILFIAQEGELALLPRWGTAALFAPIPLIYGVVLGMVIDRLASGRGETAAQNAGILRKLGTLTAIAASIGAAIEIFQGAAFPAANVIGVVASMRVETAAGIATALTLIAGVIALSRSGAAGDHRLVNAGLGIALLTFTLTGLVALAGGLGSMEMHGLVRLLVRLEYDGTLILLIVPIVLSLLGILAAGIAALRTRRWSGWHVYTPLAVGVVPFLSVLLLHPVFLPALAGISVFGRNQLGHWVGAAYLLAWLAFGLALRAESER
jgi:hypothetical protein